jgi:5-methylcytosine-specific restriction endonuclease McrA
MPKNIHLDPEYQKKYRSQKEHTNRQKKYRQTLKDKKKKLLFESIGDSCSFCGSKENLELDHINPKLGGHYKTRGHRGMNTSVKHIQKQFELNNLRWLCHKCHKEHSKNQLSAAWNYFINLPLDKQEELLLQYETQKQNYETF